MLLGYYLLARQFVNFICDLIYEISIKKLYKLL